ncbi:MAG: UvrD-helicase domain-containing protein, partial [Actinomycetes bacterium]
MNRSPAVAPASPDAGLRLSSGMAEGPQRPVLSAEQAEIVSLGAGSGPVLVLGGPGSGKTQVLVELAVRRILNGDTGPDRMLIVAPTRLAAARLRDSITARLERSLSAPPARTWSSYAFDLIRRARV